jgi:general secretion pathway protein G
MKSQIANRKSQIRSAFTLIELLLVLVILAVLAAVVVPKFTHRSEEAKVAAAKADIASLDVALDAYEIDNSRFPTSEEGLAALVAAPSSATAWKGPYIKRAADKDPWGNPYVYHSPGQHNPTGYDLYSYGPDGREGNDDIDNWSKR